MTALLDLNAIRASNPLPAVVGASLKLQRAGREWKACCPFHADRSPSFTIFDGGARFHCFGCGASGDVIDYVQQLRGVGLREAAAMLDSGALPIARIETSRRGEVEPERDTIAEARAIWRTVVDVAGTAAESYLRRRAIHIPAPRSVGFARLRYGGRGQPLPCLVAVVVSVENKLVGVQRCFLDEDGRKADVPAPKLSLGRIRGAAIRLAPAAAELVVTGGVEDGLTLQQELGLPVWAAAGEGNMSAMRLPDIVRAVVIGADNDASGEAHAQRAAEAFSLQGRKVRIMRPSVGHKDFNAELMGVRA
jgi:DNA primase